VAGDAGEQADLATTVDGPGERADGVDVDPVNLLGGTDEGIGEASCGQVDDDVVDHGAVGVMLDHVNGTDVCVDGTEGRGDLAESSGNIGQSDAHQVGQGRPRKGGVDVIGQPDCSEGVVTPAR
jgi:hypothetical protein